MLYHILQKSTSLREKAAHQNEMNPSWDRGKGTKESHFPSSFCQLKILNKEFRRRTNWPKKTPSVPNKALEVLCIAFGVDIRNATLQPDRVQCRLSTISRFVPRRPVQDTGHACIHSVQWARRLRHIGPISRTKPCTPVETLMGSLAITLSCPNVHGSVLRGERVAWETLMGVRNFPHLQFYVLLLLQFDQSQE